MRKVSLLIEVSLYVCAFQSDQFKQTTQDDKVGNRTIASYDDGNQDGKCTIEPNKRALKLLRYNHCRSGNERERERERARERCAVNKRKRSF